MKALLFYSAALLLAFFCGSVRGQEGQRITLERSGKF